MCEFIAGDFFFCMVVRVARIKFDWCVFVVACVCALVSKYCLTVFFFFVSKCIGKSG